MIKLKDLIKEEYGGPGKYELPENHKAGMRVPKGGSSCSTCRYWNSDEQACSNQHYQAWSGTNKIPHPADEYCTDWYEPSKSI